MLSQRLFHVWTRLLDACRRRWTSRREAQRLALQVQIDFLTAISPQLRTPLNDIIGYAEYIYHNAQEPMIRFPSQIIYESGNQLLGLVNAWLDWSQLEAGLVLASPSRFDLQPWLHDLVVQHQTQADALQVTIQVQVHETVPTEVVLDRSHLGKVIVHLLHNAIKFSREGGMVKVTVDYRPAFHSLIFSVQDAGVGIPLSKHASVFQRFWQDEDYVRTPYDGTGLGLALAKKWVEFMGGDMGFNSSPNVGSIFFFSLPLTPQERPAP